jgi:selenide,water dikinase
VDALGDAGVYAIDDQRVLIQTVDVLTPISDDPYVFGQIAAANSLSDVYAMGGSPLTVLNIVCYPESISPSVIAEILKGAMSKVDEAGAVVVGGHTIKDQEVKIGLAVTGIAGRDELISNANAKPGDLLVLTKPLGTGVISTAIKRKNASETAVATSERWMSTLNRGASAAMKVAGAHACTDITGFGFLGHALLLAEASHVGLSFDVSRVPIMEEAREYANAGLFPGGSRANFAYVAPKVRYGKGVPESMRLLLCDAQTSGGLLISIEPERYPALAGALKENDVPSHWLVGRVTDDEDGQIRVAEILPELEEISLS